MRAEDFVVEVWDRVPHSNRVAVYIGAAGEPDIVARLRDRWHVAAFDEKGGPGISKDRITRENVAGKVLALANVTNPDLLVIDIDGNDVHVLEALLQHTAPRVLVIEYNAEAPSGWAQDYDPAWVWDGTDYFGASLEAINVVAEARGLRLVGCDDIGANAFFVRDVFVPLFLKADRRYKAHPRSERWEQTEETRR